jgi:hypothetical protein
MPSLETRRGAAGISANADPAAEWCRTPVREPFRARHVREKPDWPAGLRQDCLVPQSLKSVWLGLAICDFPR